jgi:hypothetical protein
VGERDGGVEPPSFDEEFSSDWSIWVLARGLPELPVTIERGWSVPVARWVGETVGAVLHIRRGEDDEDDEPESDVELLARSTAGWEYPTASGGTGWANPPLVRPPPFGGRYVFSVGMAGYVSSLLDPSGTPWAALYGLSAAPTRTITFHFDEVAVTYEVESPTGAWIVGYQARLDFSDPRTVIEAFDWAGRQIDRRDLEQEERDYHARLSAGPSEELVHMYLAKLEALGSVPTPFLSEARRRSEEMDPAQWMLWVGAALRSADEGKAT